MKKLILGNLLLSVMLLGITVNADDIQKDFDIEEDIEMTHSIESSDIGMTDDSSKQAHWEEMYQSDNRREVMTLDEYIKFQEFLEATSSSNQSSNYGSRSMLRATPSNLKGQRKEIVDEAHRHLGKRYTQEANKRLGLDAFDCSGLTYHVFKQVTGKNIGTWTLPQENSGKQISVKDAKPGDLLFWGNRGSTYHVAIYIGNNQYIHSPNYNEVVSISPIWWNAFPPSFALKMDLTETPASSVNLNNYYTVNPGKVVTKKDDSFYSSTEFNNNTRKNKILSGTILDVQGVEYNSAGVPRLKTASGYYTASKSNVIKTIGTISNYYTVNPGKVVTKKDDSFYSSVEFDNSTRKNNITSGTILDVQGIEYNSSGVPRLKTPLGYYTASKSNVIKTIGAISNYYTVNPGKVVTKKDDSFYSSVEFTNNTRKNKIPSGTILDVQGIEYNTAGVPRLKTSLGYYTASKSNVIKTINSISNYYTVNPGKVVTLKDDSFYSSVEFNNGTRRSSIKAGTGLTVQGIEYNTAGVPRLKTSLGYYTASKSNVKPIK